jgi:general secretion pathway protein F
MMPQFRYRAVTHAGEIVVGEVDAHSREEVVQRIEYLGHLPIEAEIAGSGRSAGQGHLFGLGSTHPRARDITIMLRQLAVLIGSGMTLEGALQTLAEDATRGVARFTNAVRSAISAGESFAEALDRHPATIEPMYVAMVRAGEASGRLEGVLRAIVEDRVRRELLAERINSALRYPVFLISAAVLILFFFLSYVVPQFEPVFRDLGGKLNAGAAFVLAASTWLKINFDLFLGSCLVLVLGGWLLLSRPGMRARIIGALASLPGIAGTMQDRRTARLVGTLGLLLANGVALPTTLKLLRGIVSDAQAAAALDRLHDHVRNGRRFAEALAETDLLPALAVRMLKVGDESGDLAAIAAQAAQFYEHKLGLGLDRLMGTIGPMAIILVSLLVGSLVISIMSALLSITELAM